MAQPDDKSEDLLTRLRAGDRQALADLFARQRDRLWRVADFRLDPRLRRRIDADDVLQQAYLDAALRLDHFQGDSLTSAFVWLRLVVTQTLVEVHRTHLGAQMRAAGREVSLRDGGGFDGTSVSLARQIIGQFTSPSQAAVREETLAQLEQALASMDPIDREVLALRHYEELSNSEVAAVLGIQQKAASIRYVRALARLKVILSELHGFGSSG
ncbi:MAG TPA: sigma-70 family RNA polymerase sigma factor [Gemmataceae bacterium]|jgi:RNA polymerase sigma-70 factor (ECF subfamily)|nr:sigma-70 family RNA polymerase sigma factor [Gemmataceae bacterium]